nr:immunoglobulin heavy chain junction region [Mus musculus]MBK4197310.1 immunoglobulin heavy chain junction region [Mus musculus]MBK4197311.1 immunoglobulin heavy chain junction region [Mus musculus]
CARKPFPYYFDYW